MTKQMHMVIEYNMMSCQNKVQTYQFKDYFMN